MYLFTRNTPHYNLLQYLLFLKHPVYGVMANHRCVLYIGWSSYTGIVIKLDTCLYELTYLEQSILSPPKIFTIPPETPCTFISLNSSQNVLKVIQRIKTRISCPITYFLYRKSCRLWDNVAECGTARQPTDGSIVRRMHIARWTAKA